LDLFEFREQVMADRPQQLCVAWFPRVVACAPPPQLSRRVGLAKPKHSLLLPLLAHSLSVSSSSPCLSVSCRHVSRGGAAALLAPATSTTAISKPSFCRYLMSASPPWCRCRVTTTRTSISHHRQLLWQGCCRLPLAKPGPGVA
jgi:hypothetical protein